MNTGQRHCSCGDCACFIQHNSVNVPGGFQDLRPLDQYTHLRTATGTNQQRCRRRQSQGAGARHNEDRDCGCHGGSESVPQYEPDDECEQGDANHSGDENTGDTVR